MKSRALLRSLPALGLCACLLLAQASDRSLSFDAASIRLADPAGPFSTGMRGGPGSSDPGQFIATNVTMLSLIMRAWDVPGFRISGPSWLNSDRFNLAARVPPGANPDQFRLMLQNLLADRFKLVAHTENRPALVYTLAIDSGGLKMKESRTSTQAPDDPPPPTGTPAIGKDGFPIVPPEQKGFWINFNGDHFLIQAHRVTTAALADSLANQLDRPVADETGLNGQYDFNLEFARIAVGPTPPEDTGTGSTPSIFSALKHLGLKLEPGKRSVSMVVVDRVEKTPTAN